MSDKNNMDKERFWGLIDSSRRKSGINNELFLEMVKNELLELNDNQLGKFKAIQDEYMKIAYMPGLWDAALAINYLHCTSECFMDFRAWLISQGKKSYLNVLSNPDSLVTLNTSECRFELFLYVADEVYEEHTGKKFLPDDYVRVEESERIKIHLDIKYDKQIHILKTGKEIQEYLPQICRKFYSGKDVSGIWPEWNLSDLNFFKDNRWKESFYFSNRVLRNDQYLIEKVENLLSETVQLLKLVENVDEKESLISLIKQAKEQLQNEDISMQL